MKRKKLIFIISVVVALSSLVSAQDMHYSQQFSNPLYLNPAFAGLRECPNIGISYRNQWPNVAGGFSLASVYYDQHINAIHGGFGAVVLADIQGGGTYSNVKAGVMYSYRFRLGKKLYLRLAASAAYMNRRADWRNLTFADQYDPFLGIVRPTGEQMVNTPHSKHFADFGAGALLYGENFYLGTSVDHIGRPNEAFVGIQRLSIKVSVQAGGVIYFDRTYNRKRSGDDISISPNIIFTMQGQTEELNYGLYLNVRPIILGTWLRHSFTNVDAIIGMVGFSNSFVQVAYSYDVTISRLKGTGGAHEVTLLFKLPCKFKPKSGSISRIPCPTF
ncbi:MAG: PorP/SprF family type IX secretion system membrane protein [Bacteroidales bacterium]|jgi:type IX secretion system PorP/SprF family membrane protein|nr:PorP/SprF family type IX secretion system membrane protein [Bacteroidales bacterium]